MDQNDTPLAVLKRIDAKLDRAIENLTRLAKLKAWENERRVSHQKSRAQRLVPSR